MRSRWMFSLFVFLAAIANHASRPARAAQIPEAARPNIVVILADDMGFSDIGCYGGEIRTPNIDRLAREGKRFTQFYNNARCCPTRASLLTGLYPHQAGIGHMVEDRGFPGYQGHLNDSCVTIAEALRPAGYHPLIVGKWHVGEAKGNWPTDRGFEHAYSLISGATNYFRLEKGRTFIDDGESINPMGGEGYYLTDDLSEHAARYVNEFGRKPEPFFLYLAYTSPHWPLHARPDDIAKYKGTYMKGWDALREERHRRQIELGIFDAKSSVTPRAPRAPAWDSLSQELKESFDLKMAVYAAQIDRMDQGIGKVLAALKESGADRNTLVLFLADNGGCAEEVNRGVDPKAPAGTADSYQSYGLPWANASNTPFRRFKHWVHEGGISTPLVAWWPGNVKAETKTAEPAHLIDLMPTFLELARADYPKTSPRAGLPATPLEGKSLLPVLRGERLAERPIFWEHEGNRAVRLGKWKLVALHDSPWELYDIEADRIETKDLASREPVRAKEMVAMYDAWAQRARVQPWAQVVKVGPGLPAKPEDAKNNQK